jgi:ionotropic glutamate receptor NMDA 3A
MGAAAAALMHKAHWHAFTLLIDTSLLPVQHLVSQQKRHLGGLLPRKIIYLPADERTLSARLRRVAEENGRGSVLVLGCDLNSARKVITLAGKYEMLAGRFLWLWLDLKAELR